MRVMCVGDTSAEPLTMFKPGRVIRATIPNEMSIKTVFENRLLLRGMVLRKTFGRDGALVFAVGFYDINRDYYRDCLRLDKMVSYTRFAARRVDMLMEVIASLGVQRVTIVAAALPTSSDEDFAAYTADLVFGKTCTPANVERVRDFADKNSLLTSLQTRTQMTRMWNDMLRAKCEDKRYTFAESVPMLARRKMWFSTGEYLVNSEYYNAILAWLKILSIYNVTLLDVLDFNIV